MSSCSLRASLTAASFEGVLFNLNGLPCSERPDRRHGSGTRPCFASDQRIRNAKKIRKRLNLLIATISRRAIPLAMSYQVKSGSITFVVATVRQALAMFDQMLDDAREELSICDMDGRKIDPDRLRSLPDDERGRSG